MPNTRPELLDIVERMETDTASRLGLPELPRRSVEAVIARAAAGGFHLQYGRIDWGMRQFFPHLCDDEMLDDQGYLWSTSRKSAAFASGTVTATGVDGSVIPAGTLVQRSTGEVYGTTSERTIVSGTATLEIEAELSGEDGNADAGASMTLVSPISGVNSSLEVVSLTGGLDQESIDDWRDRIIERVRFTPCAGNPVDFETWAKEISGVTRAWAYKRYFEDQPEKVALTFVCDNTEGGPIPTDEKVAEVLAYLDEKCSAVAHPVVFAPEEVSIDFDIRLSPDTSATRAAVEVELADLLDREGKPYTTIPLTHTHEAVSIAPGEYDFTMLSPAADIDIGKGQFPVLGTITWE